MISPASETASSVFDDGSSADFSPDSSESDVEPSEESLPGAGVGSVEEAGAGVGSSFVTGGTSDADGGLETGSGFGFELLVSGVTAAGDDEDGLVVLVGAVGFVVVVVVGAVVFEPTFGEGVLGLIVDCETG